MDNNNNEMQVRLSVVMSVYNERDEFLHASIQSILNQTYSDFEFIIILDNPNNERAHCLLQQYAQQDNRIRILVNEQNVGLAMSLNRGIKEAQGEIIARMDADDISLENRFERQIAYMDFYKGTDILSTNKYIIDEHDNIIGKGLPVSVTNRQVISIMQYSNVLAHPSIFMRRDKIMSIGCYRNLPTSQDLDLWLRAIDSGLVISFLDEYLIKYRINTSGITFGKSYKQSIVGMYIRQLCKERKRTGKDSFSEDDFQRFLEKYEVTNVGRAKRHQLARMNFEEGRNLIKSGSYAKGIYKSTLSIFRSKIIRGYVGNIVLCSILKSKIATFFFEMAE